MESWHPAASHHVSDFNSSIISVVVPLGPASWLSTHTTMSLLPQALCTWAFSGTCDWWVLAPNFLYLSASFTLWTTHTFMKLFLFLHFLMSCAHFFFFFVPAYLAVSSQMPVWAPFPLCIPYLLAFHKFSWKSSSLLSPLPGVSSPTHEYISLNPFLNLQTHEQLPSGHLSINIPEALQTHKSRVKQPSHQPGCSWQIESPTTQLSNIETQHRNELDSFFFFAYLYI